MGRGPASAAGRPGGGDGALVHIGGGGIVLLIQLGLKQNVADVNGGGLIQVAVLEDQHIVAAGILNHGDITALAGVAGQMGVVLLVQAVLMALFAIFISYNMFGRDYGAAVMAAGNCGWGCGSGPNAVANEKAVMDQYGWHNVAWVLYPSFAVIIDDIYNPIFLSLFGGLFKV